MKLDTMILTRLFLIGALAAGAAACSETGAAPPVGAKADAKPSAAVANAPAPTAERLTERVHAMWAKKTAAQWVEVYDMIAPQMRKRMPISQFLSGKEYHTYANPVLHEVIQLDPDGSWVRVSAIWTPRHPQIQKALQPGESVTQEVESVETWLWTDGDWYYVESASIDDFVEKHPDVLKKQPAASPAAPGAGAPAQDAAASGAPTPPK